MLSPLERILSDKKYFGLRVTPVQRAIAKAIDGFRVPESLWNHPDVRATFGNERPNEFGRQQDRSWELRAKEVLLAAGIRGGKSMLAAGLGIDRALTCDLSWFTEKEAEPVLPILSVRKDNAQAVFRHLKNLVTHSPYRENLACPPTADTVTVVHPETGIHIRIMVKAGSRAASSLASFWLVSAVFDEAFKMTGRDESVISLEDARLEVMERIIDGGQVFYLGSKWRPEGPAYTMYNTYFGKADRHVLVMNATAPMLNPRHWNKKRIARLEESRDAQAQENYICSVLGQFLEGEKDLLSLEEIQNVTRMAPVEVPYIEGCEYVAAMDPAARRNRWTLCIGGRWERGKIGVAVAREWVPGGNQRLDPDIVLGEIAEVCKKYNVYRVMTDQWSIEAMRTVAAKHGLTLVEMNSQGKTRFQEFDQVRLAVQRRTIELPPIDGLQRDLKRLKKKATAETVKIVLPETNDGRHCDFVPPLALILNHPPSEGEVLTGPVDDDADRYAAELAAADGEGWLDNLASAW